MPAASTAATSNVWGPFASAGAINGGSHAKKLPWSNRHRNVLDSFEENANAGVAVTTVAGGPESIVRLRGSHVDDEVTGRSLRVPVLVDRSHEKGVLTLIEVSRAAWCGDTHVSGDRVVDPA